MSAFFYLSRLCNVGYYRKSIKWIIVLEIYVTHDIISNNLVLTTYKRIDGIKPCE